jgi:hypothetical protein
MSLSKPLRGDIWLILERFDKKWGHVSAATMNLVEERIRILLGL